MSCLLAAYPENAMQLYQTLDYWEIRRLLEYRSFSSIPIEIKIQISKNQAFNDLLDKHANKKTEWNGMPELMSVAEIKPFSTNYFDDYDFIAGKLNASQDKDKYDAVIPLEDILKNAI